MIVARVIGGLGNQLFQYAAARHLAEIHKTALRIDISEFKTWYKLRKYSLWAFNIQKNFASLEEIPQEQESRGHGLTRICEKQHFHFDNEILSLPDNIYLDGYWQSEKYFIDIEAIIRQEFTIKTPQVDKDKELASQMASCESVSLHIRRGDYVSNPSTNLSFGTCSLDYYLYSVQFFIQALESPHFFIFSDDMEWSRSNLGLPYSITFVDHNGPDKNYEDLRLMSQCKHHIIANSSFSWWGAWLGQYPKKIVLAPKRWFRSTRYNAQDLLPDAWIRI